MQFKANQRVAYYKVTGMSKPMEGVAIDSVLVDRMRGKTTSWEFFNTKTGKAGASISGDLLGYARIDPETMKPIPEPELQAKLDDRKAKLEAATN